MKRRTGRPAWRRRVLLAGWLLCGVAIVARAAQIQVLDGGTWQEVADRQHRKARTVAAARGAVLDRDREALALSREVFSVGVAPAELRDREEAGALLRRTLGLGAREAARVVRSGRSWVVVPGRFPPSVREDLSGVRGVYLERHLERHRPHGELAAGVLGSVIDDQGRGGIEQAFETLLRGTDGREIVARDHVGEPIPGETYLVDAPRSGGQVVLSLDLDLQEIAREALREAIDRTGARAGDVLVTNPETGDVLALVSIRDGAANGLGAIHAPFEPGSTLKPFTVAGMLERGLASLDDTVDVGDGTWTTAGRTLHDVHAEGLLSVADALRVSSNVGVAKAAQAMAPGQQYETLRDFGFGVPTGVPLPGEEGGRLARPSSWHTQTPASLAIGYEMSATPLQMAMAYGALANGGVLMQPRLVLELRDGRGRTVERFDPRPVRRVVSEEVAEAVSAVLVDVVEDGTGTAAQMGLFRVAGKSGTSRAYVEGVGYLPGEYNASFVGFFPAEAPQLVVFVKLENPRGAYYGGAVAAPVTRATMEAVLASRSAPIDRAELLRAMQSPTAETTLPVPSAAQPATTAGPSPVRFASNTLPSHSSVPRAGASVIVPDVAGLSARSAAAKIHALGLRVRQDGLGRIVGTVPGRGARVVVGDTIRLRVRGRHRG